MNETDEPQTPDPEAHDPEAHDPDTGEEDGTAKLRREAAKYRRQARDAETERDALRSVVTGLRRAEVERLATAGTDGLAQADDLWLAGVELDTLLDDEGAVDPGKVQETVAALTASRPHWQRPTVPSFDGGARLTPPEQTSWADALRRS